MHNPKGAKKPRLLRMSTAIIIATSSRTFTNPSFLFITIFRSDVILLSFSASLCLKAGPQLSPRSTGMRMKADSHIHQLTWLHSGPQIKPSYGCKARTCMHAPDNHARKCVSLAEHTCQKTFLKLRLCDAAR